MRKYAKAAKSEKKKVGMKKTWKVLHGKRLWTVFLKAKGIEIETSSCTKKAFDTAESIKNRDKFLWQKQSKK